MNWYRNRKISTKLISGFILVSIFFIIIGIFVISNILKITNLDRKLYQENTLPLSSLSKIQQDFLKIQVNLGSMAIDSSGNITKYTDAVTALSKDLSDNETVYLKSLSSPEQISDFNNLKSAITKYGDVRVSYITFIKSGDKDGALALMNGYGATLGKDVDTFSNNLFNLNYKLAKQRSDSNTIEGNKSIVVMASILLLVIILAVVLGFLIAKIISGPIKRLVEAANKISEGDLDFEINLNTKDEVGILGQAFSKIINSLKNLIKDTDMLANAAVIGRLDVRVDASKHKGDYGKIVEGVNKTLDTLIGHIDALPSPVMIIDNEFNIQYMNKTGADLIGKPKAEILGTKCYDNYKMGHCQTTSCACAIAMKQGVKFTSDAAAHPNGETIEVQYTGIPLRDKQGSVIGAMEIIVDETEIKEAVKKADDQSKQLEQSAIISYKQAKYQETEVEKLIVNLEKLSKGDLNIETNVAERDIDTKQIAENFDNINSNLNKSSHAIRRMVKDVNSLINESIEGNLSKRADTSKHEGDYKKIVEGVNKTLDAIIQPVEETSAVLKEMANGNLSMRVQGNYRGAHADIKNAMNSTLDTLSLYINEISEVLSEMADSNFDLEINNEYKGDFQEIKIALNLIIGSFNNLFGDINSSADQVATGSNQLSTGSQALSEGSSHQASAIEELTSSINEVSLQTKENAVDANQANELAFTAYENAENGNTRMKEMLISMERINESSSSISKIIKVIDDIAFQTNILALNAAVEAARAGQYGRGFAVVAQEVRNLATRSANAAEETSELIEESIKQVKAGSKLAELTSESLSEMIAGIAKVVDLVGKIASASDEQAVAISQINKGIDEVSQVIKTNSATAEESAASSEELSSQADVLKDMVGNFKLKDLDILTVKHQDYKNSQDNSHQNKNQLNNSKSNKNYIEQIKIKEIL